MKNVMLLGRLVLAGGLFVGAMVYAWYEPGTAAVWLAGAYIIWPSA